VRLWRCPVSVHIDELSSEVVLEPEAQAAAAATATPTPGFAELDRWRALRERARVDAERTRAEGYSD
jgi:hypothetical protein